MLYTVVLKDKWTTTSLEWRCAMKWLPYSLTSDYIVLSESFCDIFLSNAMDLINSRLYFSSRPCKNVYWSWIFPMVWVIDVSTCRVFVFRVDSSFCSDCKTLVSWSRLAYTACLCISNSSPDSTMNLSRWKLMLELHRFWNSLERCSLDRTTLLSSLLTVATPSQADIEPSLRSTYRSNLCTRLSNDSIYRYSVLHQSVRRW